MAFASEVPTGALLKKNYWTLKKFTKSELAKTRERLPWAMTVAQTVRNRNNEWVL